MALRQISIASTISADDYDFSDQEDFSQPEEVVATEDDEARCLTLEELAQDQLEAIDDVNSIFEISPGAARALLAHCNWDKEKLLEKYYNGDSEDMLFNEAHVVNPRKIARTEQEGPVTCGICTCDYDAAETMSLECGHRFCTMCWENHISTQVTAGNPFVECPEGGCKVQVDELTVTRMLKDPELLTRFKHAICRAYIANNPLLSGCPQPDCPNAIKVRRAEARTVRCTCGFRFCFACRRRDHDPLPCALLQVWNQKTTDEGETARYLAVNTKDCPKCNVVIEKNGGCNHMTCRVAACKYEFCWICLGPWSAHSGSYYQCNRYTEHAEADKKRNESRAALDRYLFYFQRYQNHENSIKLEDRLRRAVARRQDELQRQDRTWIEVQYLQDALDALSVCRTALKTSYCFAYFTIRNAHLDLFEIHQSSLEAATEDLSHMLENKGGEEATAKAAILDKTAYCRQLRTVLVKFVKEGLEMGAWNLTDRARALCMPH